MVRRRGKLRWRDYRTPSGSRPVKELIDTLTDEEAAAVVAAMKEVSSEGLAAARHLREDVYEVRAEAKVRSFRILFAQETKFILLSLHAFAKKTQKTPTAELELAEQRLASWRRRQYDNALRHGFSAIALPLWRCRRILFEMDDFLDELIAERTHRNPGFPDLVAEAEQRRRLARRLAELRTSKGLSQTVVAARMDTAASVVSKLESGADVRVSTLQRYCAAIGATYEVRLGPRRGSISRRPKKGPARVVKLDRAKPMRTHHVGSATRRSA